MSVENLKRCSNCKCTLLLKYFETNKKGELFKTCNNCRKRVETSRGRTYTDYTFQCECGESMSEPFQYKKHVQTDAHRQWLHSQKIKMLDDTQKQTNAEIEIPTFKSMKPSNLTPDGKRLCSCRCVVVKFNNHMKTQRHTKRLKWIEQGLDPDEEEKLEEREFPIRPETWAKLHAMGIYELRACNLIQCLG